jgi:hypothetical protein
VVKPLAGDPHAPQRRVIVHQMVLAPHAHRC